MSGRCHCMGPETRAIARFFASTRPIPTQKQDPTRLYSCAPRMTSYKRPPPPILAHSSPSRPSYTGRHRNGVRRSSAESHAPHIHQGTPPDHPEAAGGCGGAHACRSSTPHRQQAHARLRAKVTVRKVPQQGALRVLRAAEDRGDERADAVFSDMNAPREQGPIGRLGTPRRVPALAPIINQPPAPFLDPASAVAAVVGVAGNHALALGHALTVDDRFPACAAVFLGKCVVRRACTNVLELAVRLIVRRFEIMIGSIPHLSFE